MVTLAMLAVSSLIGSAPPAPGEAPDTRPAPPTVADPLRGLDLWRGAKVGMSAAEVLRQFPGVVRSAEPTILTGGQTDLLQLPNLDLEGHPSTAHFYFAGPELVAVELTASDLRPGAPQQNLAVARGIAAAYATRYGPGYDCGPKGLGDVNTYECKWLKGRLAIRLWYMDVAGQAPLFYVAYRQADDPSYDL